MGVEKSTLPIFQDAPGYIGSGGRRNWTALGDCGFSGAARDRRADAWQERTVYEAGWRLISPCRRPTNTDTTPDYATSLLMTPMTRLSGRY